eukprot:5084958-Lingulodinium_polyedra.AAC.1
MPVGLEVLLHLIWAHWPNMLPDQGPATGTQKMMQQAVTAPEALEAGRARVGVEVRAHGAVVAVALGQVAAEGSERAECARALLAFHDAELIRGVRGAVQALAGQGGPALESRGR